MSASRCSSRLRTSPTIVKSYVSLLVPRAMPSIRDTYSSGRRAWELRHSFSSRTSKLSNPTAVAPSWVPLSAGHSVLVHVFMAGGRLIFEARIRGAGTRAVGLRHCSRSERNGCVYRVRPHSASHEMGEHPGRCLACRRARVSTYRPLARGTQLRGINRDSA